MKSSATSTDSTSVDQSPIGDGTRYVPWKVMVEQLNEQYGARALDAASAPAKKCLAGVGYVGGWSLLGENPGN